MFSDDLGRFAFPAFQSLISFLIGGGAVFAIGRIFADRWLETKFKEKLQLLAFDQTKETERLKGEINQEVEHLRARINAEADRRLRLHQYEFETLPKLWDLLDRTYTDVAQVLAAADFTPDLNGASEERLREFATQRRYSPSDTRFLIESGNKNDTVTRITARMRYNSASKTIWKLGRYNRRYGIFW